MGARYGGTQRAGASEVAGLFFYVWSKRPKGPGPKRKSSGAREERLVSTRSVAVPYPFARDVRSYNEVTGRREVGV